jgi:hypothetical protein
MPIPFLVAGVIAATTLTGIGSGVKAVKNNKEAKDVNQSARYLVKYAERILNTKRESSNDSIETLGKEKITILSNTVKDFINYFQLIKNIEINNQTAGIEQLKNIGVSKDLLQELRTESYQAIKVASGGIASLGTGVAAAYGAYAGTMALGTASTGAAISGLSGVAATNATLAWLGGGALSAGGYGIAGGTMVLGGIVAGPALAVGGLIMSAQSKKKLNAAYENYSEAKTIAEQMKSAGVVLTNIQKRSDQLTSLLTKIDRVFIKSIEEMRNIISTKGTNWGDFSRDQKESIHRTFLLAQLIKGVIDTPLLDEDGAITRKSAEVLESGRQAIDKITAQKMV